MTELENPEDVLTWDTEKLWNYYNVLKDELELEETTHLQILNGKQNKYPIWYIIHEWYTAYPGNKRVSIHGYCKISMQEFMEDKDQRDSLMRKIIMDNTQKEELTQPRN